MEYDPAEYTFLALCNQGKSLGVLSSLGYLVSLVDSPSHDVLDLRIAHQVINVSFESEAALTDASEVLSSQEGTLPSGFYPQTPVLITKRWSPISALLQRTLLPINLRRDSIAKSVATGIWSPAALQTNALAELFENAKPVSEVHTVESLFWAVLIEAFGRAQKRHKWVSIIAEPGWSYESSIGSLPEWTKHHLATADKILWKRTPVG
jgi:hypothetical protein